MVTKNGVCVHIDPTGDRVTNADLEFTGWIAAQREVKAVWLPAAGKEHLTTCCRPDVQRVFPTHVTLGFCGKTNAAAIGSAGLKLAVQTDKETLEVEHPLPKPLPELPAVTRFVIALHLFSLGVRRWLARKPGKRWALTLRRHLLCAQRRGGIFRRAHTDALLREFAIIFPEATFLQIGANDGFTGDPLYPLINQPATRWRGVLVEPVAHLFAQLAQRYENNSRLQLERAAICETDGSVVIHRLEPGNAETVLYHQIPSLDPELLRENAKQFGDGRLPLVSETVPALSVATLLQKQALKDIDLLVIDAEGWDWRILRQFSLTSIRPWLILYEHQHLSASERGEAQQFLARHGYGWAQTEEGDTIAWRLS